MSVQDLLQLAEAVGLTMLAFAVAIVAGGSARRHWKLYRASRNLPVILASAEQLAQMEPEPWNDGKGRWPEPKKDSRGEAALAGAFASMSRLHAKRVRDGLRVAQAVVNFVWAALSTFVLAELGGVFSWMVGTSMTISPLSLASVIFSVGLLTVTAQVGRLEALAEMHDRRAAAYARAAAQPSQLEGAKGCCPGNEACLARWENQTDEVGSLTTRARRLIRSLRPVSGGDV